MLRTDLLRRSEGRLVTGLRLLIEVLVFDDCPGAVAAQALVEAVVTEEGLAGAVDVRLMPVEDDETARRIGFLGSPTIRVNGRDIEVARREEPGHSLSCRVYRAEDGALTGVPTAAVFRAALSEARNAVVQTDFTVLFVCVHNAGRSQMAEALVNHLARERNLPIRAVSAGTVAGDSINPVAAMVMREIGISMEGQRPKQLTEAMADAADRVITMGCGVDADACPARVRPMMEDWGLDDPKGQAIETVRHIRDQIAARVEALLAEMTDMAST